MNSTDLASITLGLLSALSWGAGDFSGGLATKRTNVYGVILISQLIGISLLILLSFAFRETFPPFTDLVLGGITGLVGAVGLVALYRALASGRMGIAAPISAILTAALPVIFAMFTQGVPPALKLAGFALALVAVWLVSRPEGGTFDPRDLTLPTVAGVCFGGALILIDRANDVSALWPLVAARATSITFLIAFVLLTKRQWRPAGAGSYAPILLAGLLDVGGNLLYSLAAQTGHLAEAAVLSSLYPAATVILAWGILKERLLAPQKAGVVVALVAIALIAS